MKEAEVITEREPLVAPGACVQIDHSPPPPLPSFTSRVQSSRFHLSWNTAPGGYTVGFQRVGTLVSSGTLTPRRRVVLDAVL